MPAPLTGDLEAIARGAGEGGRRCYTTSKLLVTAVTGALARERPQTHVSCIDPGLMPSTGLARDYPASLRRALAALERPLSLLPFASTAQRSGRVLASLLLDDPPPVASGSVVDHRGRPARISARARDGAFGAQVLALKRYTPASGERDGRKWFWRRGAMRRSSRSGYSQRVLNPS